MGKLKKKNRHHATPKSRGGSYNLENIARIRERDHNHYHVLFSNLTPQEIIPHLVNKYWCGNWDYVREAYDKRSKNGQTN